MTTKYAESVEVNKTAPDFENLDYETNASKQIEAVPQASSYTEAVQPAEESSVLETNEQPNPVVLESTAL